MTYQPKPDRHDLWQQFFQATKALPAEQHAPIKAYVDHLEVELHQAHCQLARHQIVHWPRIRDLPEAERVPFRKWLAGQTVPMIETLAYEEQDAYYPWDYERWKSGRPVVD